MPPTFSVVIPTRDRPRRLRHCLEALAAIRYPDDAYEVVVVDDGSRTPLDPVVAPFRDRMEVRLLRQENAGPAAARNAGVELASHDFMAFTDDDCAPDPDWLRPLAAELERFPKAMVGGRTVNVLANTYAGVSQDLIDYLYAYYRGGDAAGAFFTSNNMAVRKTVFRELGGFRTEFRLAAGEDRELSHRWSRSGRPLRYVPEAVVRHAHVMTLRSFVRQHVNYGRGARTLHRIRSQEGHPPLRPEPPSFYLRLLAHPFRVGHPLHAALGRAALMGFTQAATVIGFLLESLRE